MALIKLITKRLKNRGFRYVLNESPNYLLNLLRGVVINFFGIFVINRNDLVFLSEGESRYYEIYPEGSVNIRPPVNDKFPNKFFDLIGTSKTDKQFICVINNVTLIGPYAVQLTSNLRFPLEHFGTKRVLVKRLSTDLYSVLGKYTKALSTGSLIPDVPEHNYESAVVLVARSGNSISDVNYGHWVGEILPQIQILLKFEKLYTKKIIYLITRDAPSWVFESLVILGIDPKNIKIHDEWPIKVENLILPSKSYRHSYETELNPRGRDWVRNKLLSSMSMNFNSNYSGYLYVSRQDDLFRKIENFDDIKPILKRFNFEIINPQNISLTREIKYFANANVILGPIGSNLQGFSFSTNAIVVAITPYHLDLTDFFVVASELNLEYLIFRANSVEPNRFNKNYNMIVDPDKLTKTLEKLTSEY